MLSFKLCLLLSVVGAGVCYAAQRGDWCWSCLVPVALYVITGGWRRVRIVLATLPRDLKGARARVTCLREFKRFGEHTKTVPRRFEEVARRHPDKACFVFEKKTYTFGEMSQLSSAVGVVLQRLPLQPRDCVGLFMPNKPEFVAIWLGAAKVGCPTALVNTHVRGPALLHSLKAANCNTLVFDTELASAVDEVRSQLEQVGVTHLLQWQAGKLLGASASLQQEVEKVRVCEPETVRNLQPYVADSADTLMYIYTSGTTGLPKAAILRHRKFNHPATGTDVMLLRPNDIIYNPLPLYHSSGGVLGVGFAILRGHTVVLRSKFSASHFFEDCVANKCTVAQYIGEMCRYVLAQPERATDKAHSVRLLIGNGLRKQVWIDFVARFKIEQIAEFYAATEGNSQLINYSNKLGACGFLSQVIPMSISLIKVDRETGEPIRDAHGMCIHCKPGEAGQLVGSVTTGDKTLSDFAGYTDKAATEKKLIKDVFKAGDKAFVTGDILEMDEFGYVYFVDRIGDTFRWKGENVSTTEVEAVLNELIGKEEDVVVYGVEVPGAEGRAGMATVTDRAGKDVVSSSEFLQKLERRLPTYARPLFIRVVKGVEITGTCKLRKVELKALGFKPDSDDARLLFYNAQKRVYEAVTNDIYDSLCAGKVRL